MSAFISQLAGKGPALWLPVFSLILFIALFAGVVIRVARRGRAGYARDERLPLERDDD